MNKLLKSILSLVLCISCVSSLAACGQQNNTTADSAEPTVSHNTVADSNTDDSADSTPEKSTAEDSNILVAYFSWSGNTQQVANWISDKTGGELFRITPELEYTEDDVFDRAQEELNSGTRPPLSSHIDSETMAEYDVIFIGFPIWWYDLPMPVWSFLEEYDLSGKTIIPFFTHNGSSSGASSVSTVAELCPDPTVLIDDYFTYSGNNVDEAESDVDEWLTELGYKN
ncbi:MAG: flavodoxin [Faecalispora jeddahensis]